MKNMIFHLPYFLDENMKSGSHIRPLKMINGFKKIGYNVEIISGYQDNREKVITKIKNNIDNGIKYDFCYSESSTMPTMLTEKNHLPKYPSLDFNFFKYLNENKIKIGLFYRDCLWAFSEEYDHLVSLPKRTVSKYYYKKDLKNYNKYIDQVYLPSLKMREKLPIYLETASKILPPGLDEIIDRKPTASDKLRLFYVGGLDTSLYNLEMLFDVVGSLDFVYMTICVRKDEWDNLKDTYSKYMKNNNIHIIHKSGKEFEDDIINSDFTILFYKVTNYRSFAMPVKLFEYLQYLKPIISTSNVAGDFIVENNIGYVIDYDREKLKEKLTYIYENKNDILENFRPSLLQVAKNNTWENRALEVSKDLI